MTSLTPIDSPPDLDPDAGAAARALAALWRGGDPADPAAARQLRPGAGPAARPVAAPSRGLRRRHRGAVARDRGGARAAVARGGPRRAARRVRLRFVPPRPAGDHRGAARRPRLRRRHADRRGQVAHLPDPGARAGRDDAGDLAADRADEGSGRRDERGRPARHLPELDARPGRTAAAHARSGGRRIRALLRRARRHRSVGRPRCSPAWTCA